MRRISIGVQTLWIVAAFASGQTTETAYRHASIDVEGVATHYIEAGEGAPFVLVHGGLAWSSGEANYGDVVGPLGRQFHAIAPDIIGFGKTRPRGARDFSGQAQGNFLIAFIEKLDVGPVFLTGNSHGGFLTQYVAHARPDLVMKLIITNSLNGTSRIPDQPEGASYIYAPSGHQYARQTREQIRAMLEGYYQHRELLTEERVQLVYDNYVRNYEYAHARGEAVSSSVALLNENLSYQGKHISDWAGKFEIPVLLMWSEPGSRIEWGLSHFFRVPGAEMHLFPWSGHHLFTDQSERWVQVVADWLKNEPARPPSSSRSSRAVAASMTPAQFPEVTEPRLSENDDYTHAWIDVEGVKTHYVQAGEGEPFVLVHGGGASSSGEANYWDVIGPLGKSFHVIAPDVVGFGYTSPRGPEDYSAQAQGDFLVRFIEALNVGPVFLNGNSHGGFLTQYVAHERPDLVRKLVITNSLNGTYRIPRLPEGASYIYAPGGHQYQEKNVEETRKTLQDFYFHRDLVTDERVQLVHDIYQRNHEYADKRGRAVSYSVEALNQNLSYQGKHITEWAGELQMPVLLMWSEPGSKIEWGLSHFFKVPGAEMHLLPWSGHHLFADQRDRWVQVVTNWLKNEPARRPSITR